MSRLWRLAAIAVFAAGYLYLCGKRRLLMPTCYAYTGGFELLQGRLPYRDFRFVVGPVLFLLQALFFKLFGLAYTRGYLAHAAALNALAACMIYDALLRRTRLEAAALGGAALTAVWFYPIYHASPWYDQESFFFLIASLWMLARSEGSRRENMWVALAGACAAVSFFTKQSEGALGVLCLTLYAAQARGLLKAAWFLAAAGMGILALGAVFASWGGFPVFAREFLLLPMSAGRLAFLSRQSFWWLGLGASILLYALGTARREPLLLLPLGLSLGAIAATSWMYSVFLLPLLAFPALRERQDRSLLAALCLLQLGGRLASNNEIKLFWPFLGFIFGLWVKAAMDWKAERPLARLAGLAAPRPLVRVWLWSGFAFLMALGLRLSFWHKVWSAFPMSTLYAGFFLLALALSAAAPCLGSLRRSLSLAAWSRSLTLRHASAGLALSALALALFARAAKAYERNLSNAELAARGLRTRPTAESAVPSLRGVLMTREEASALDALVPHLQGLPPSRKPVFVYSECDLVYPLIGQAMPQSELWFDPTLSFRPGDGTGLRLLSELEKNKVGTVVLCAPYSDLDLLPELGGLLRGRGELELDLSLFRVYRLR